MKKQQQKRQKRSVIKSNDWKPNAKQICLANLLASPEDKRTKIDKCKEVGVTPKTMYEWLKDERFLDYMNNLIDRYTSGAVPDAWRALIRKVTMGDTPAIKLFFELKELVPELKHKKQIDKERLDIERKKLQIIEDKVGNNNDETFNLHNDKITVLASLINNAVPCRTLEDFEEKPEGKDNG